VGKHGKRVPAKPKESSDQAPSERSETLAQSLRDQFDEIRNEPIPQELQDLVEALRAAEKKVQTRH